MKPSPIATVPDAIIDRTCMVNGVFGETGVGKSYQTEKEIKLIVQPIPGQKSPRKVLMFDTNGEYTKFPAITQKQIEGGYFDRAAAARINAQGLPPEKKKEMAMRLCQTFYNGHMFIDDIDNFNSYSRDQDYIGALMGARHKGLDLTIIHQSLEMAVPNFWRNVTTIRLHQQASGDKELKERSKGKFPILKIASIIVENQYRAGNIRFFVNIHLRNLKIYGMPYKDEFEKAVQKFLILNPEYMKEDIAEISITHNASKLNGNLKSLGLAKATQRFMQYHGQSL